MAKIGDRATTVLPNSGNREADQAWAGLLVRRDVALFWEDHEEFLRQTLHAITGKEDNTDAELGYLVDLILGPPHRKP